MKEEKKKTESSLIAPAEFWRALLVVRNAALEKCWDEWRREVGVIAKPGSFRDSFGLVDNYLDRWLDENE